MNWYGRSAAPASTSRAERRWARGLVALALSAFAALVAAQAPKPATAPRVPSSATPPAPSWAPIAKDGLRDPSSPAVRILQDPGEALSRLPRDNAGNRVNWVRALEDGAIAPRANLRPSTEVRLLDTELMLNQKGGMPMVRFPHRAHSQWLDCSNCHEQLFRSKAGANKLSMFRMLEGEQCGVCHGAVAFPLTECNRCHNTPRPGAPAVAARPPAAPSAAPPAARAP